MTELRTVRVTREYKPQYPDPLCGHAGDRVSVGREDPDWPGWKWCTAADGRQGWVPVELLRDAADGDPETALLAVDYSAVELAVQPGEKVTIHERRRGWLLVSNACRQQGWIPASHTK